MTDRIQEVVVRQAQAMGADLFEIGLYKPTPPNVEHWAEMLLRTWDVKTIIESIRWLKYENADGRNIYIRPKGEHSLSLVDDLTSVALEQMKHSGFTPAVIVETSPENFQAWLNHGRVLPKETSTVAARALVEQFGGDSGSADWRHFGRLAGFSNRKDKHRQPGGHYPLVRLVHATGEVYEQALEFVHSIEEQVEQKRIDVERHRQRFPNTYHANGAKQLKTINDFRRDPKYRCDGNRIDLAYALYAMSNGVPEDQIREAIASRDLNKKGSLKRQADYIERTIEKAASSVGREGMIR